MHRNFYKNDWSELSFRYALEDVENLTDGLETIRNLLPRDFIVRDNDDRIRLGRLLGLQRADRPTTGNHPPFGYSQIHTNDTHEF